MPGSFTNPVFAGVSAASGITSTIADYVRAKRDYDLKRKNVRAKRDYDLKRKNVLEKQQEVRDQILSSGSEVQGLLTELNEVEVEFEKTDFNNSIFNQKKVAQISVLAEATDLLPLLTCIPIANLLDKSVKGYTLVDKTKDLFSKLANFDKKLSKISDKVPVGKSPPINDSPSLIGMIDGVEIKDPTGDLIATGGKYEKDFQYWKNNIPDSVLDKISKIAGDFDKNSPDSRKIYEQLFLSSKAGGELSHSHKVEDVIEVRKKILLDVADKLSKKGVDPKEANSTMIDLLINDPSLQLLQAKADSLPYLKLEKILSPEQIKLIDIYDGQRNYTQRVTYDHFKNIEEALGRSLSKSEIDDAFELLQGGQDKSTLDFLTRSFFDTETKNKIYSYYFGSGGDLLSNYKRFKNLARRPDYNKYLDLVLDTSKHEQINGFRKQYSRSRIKPGEEPDELMLMRFVNPKDAEKSLSLGIDPKDYYNQGDYNSFEKWKKGNADARREIASEQDLDADKMLNIFQSNHKDVMDGYYYRGYLRRRNTDPLVAAQIESRQHLNPKIREEFDKIGGSFRNGEADRIATKTEGMTESELKKLRESGAFVVEDGKYYYKHFNGMEDQVKSIFTKSLDEINNAGNDLERVLAIKKLERELVLLHPFVDGNGRIIRNMIDGLLDRFDLPLSVRHRENEFTTSVEEMTSQALEDQALYITSSNAIKSSKKEFGEKNVVDLLNEAAYSELVNIRSVSSKRTLNLSEELTKIDGHEPVRDFTGGGAIAVFSNKHLKAEKHIHRFETTNEIFNHHAKLNKEKGIVIEDALNLLNTNPEKLNDKQWGAIMEIRNAIRYINANLPTYSSKEIKDVLPKSYEEITSKIGKISLGIETNVSPKVLKKIKSLEPEYGSFPVSSDGEDGLSYMLGAHQLKKAEDFFEKAPKYPGVTLRGDKYRTLDDVPKVGSVFKTKFATSTSRNMNTALEFSTAGKKKPIRNLYFQRKKRCFNRENVRL